MQRLKTNDKKQETMKKYLIILILLSYSCCLESLEGEIDEPEVEQWECPLGTKLPGEAFGTVDNPFEGDILIDPKKGNGLTVDLWPNRIVPVFIDERFAERSPERLAEIYETFDRLGTIDFTFIILTVDDIFSGEYPNYIYVKYAGFGYSYIGMHGGEQQLYLPFTYNGNTYDHEFGHALGLGHLHTTCMQDEWLTIYHDNIQPDMEKFFQPWCERDDRLKNSAEHLTYYDSISVMNYGSNAYAIDVQKPTMTTKAGTWFDPSDTYSDGDLLSIDRMYDCGGYEN